MITNNSDFSPEILNNNFDNKNNIEINEIKEIELYEDPEECKKLIKIIKEEQNKLSAILDKIDDVKKEYEKIYNEKQIIQEYIRNSVEIYNKTTKK
ncbi:hypothetical protein PCANB_001916 [Pneumocystis canis]|nr:hypothetical protein PCANB_001916 [Pneumocystis canis]